MAGVIREARAAQAGGRRMRTWLRRNRWALLSLPLLPLALLLPQIDRFYNVFIANEYRVAVEAPPGEQASYGGGRIRLISAAPFQPRDYAGEVVAAPAGFTFVRAVVAFDLDEHDSLAACSIFLEDSLGRRHQPAPVPLAGTPYSSGGCADYDKHALAFESTLYFLLPPNAEMAAIRIELDAARPRFARLRID
jgi:hypothetical protein